MCRTGGGNGTNGSGADLPAAVLIIKDPLGDPDASPRSSVRLACPASRHDGRMVRDGPETSSRVPRDRAGADSVCQDHNRIASVGEDLPFACRSRIIPGLLVSHGRAVPVFGMLEVVLHRHLVAGRCGLPGKFQVAGVLRHSALAAAPAAPPINTTGTALL